MNLRIHYPSTEYVPITGMASLSQYTRKIGDTGMVRYFTWFSCFELVSRAMVHKCSLIPHML